MSIDASDLRGGYKALKWAYVDGNEPSQANVGRCRIVEAYLPQRAQRAIWQERSGACSHTGGYGRACRRRREPALTGPVRPSAQEDAYEARFTEEQR